MRSSPLLLRVRRCYRVRGLRSDAAGRRRTGHLSRRVDRDPLITLNMGMHQEVVALAGGFDERLGPGTPYPAGEDNDFGFRALEAGCTVWALRHLR
jgi:hypothetical protein